MIKIDVYYCVIPGGATPHQSTDLGIMCVYYNRFSTKQESEQVSRARPVSTNVKVVCEGVYVFECVNLKNNSK